jgi:hypothetical protein
VGLTTKKSGGKSHRQSVRNKQHKGYLVCYVNLFRGATRLLQYNVNIRRRCSVQPILLAADSGSYEHEREHGNYHCLGIHKAPQ